MFGQKSKNQKGGRRREEEEEGGRKKCRRWGRKNKSKPVVGADGPARFPGQRLSVLHSATSLRGGKKTQIQPRHSAPVYDPTSLFLRAVFFFKKSQIQPIFFIFWFMIGCIYIVVCDLNMKITSIALFGCSLGFSDFFFCYSYSRFHSLEFEPQRSYC